MVGSMGGPVEAECILLLAPTDAATPLLPSPCCQGLWNPALLASQAAQCGIQPNDLHLGGPCGAGAAGQPGMLLLTGANSGGKSTLLRAACLAAVMAQVGRQRRLLRLIEGLPAPAGAATGGPR